MNAFVFYEQLEMAVQYGLDIAIPSYEVKELFDDLNDLIKTARESEERGKVNEKVSSKADIL